jgi:hypothetical protein
VVDGIDVLELAGAATAPSVDGATGDPSAAAPDGDAESPTTDGVRAAFGGVVEVTTVAVIGAASTVVVIKPYRSHPTTHATACRRPRITGFGM